MFYLLGMVICAGLALIPAKMGEEKGYEFWVFYAFGFFFFIPAIIVAAVITEKNVRRTTYTNTYAGYQAPVANRAAYPGSNTTAAPTYAKEKWPKKIEMHTIYARNCFIDVPLRPLSITFHQNADGSVFGTLRLREYLRGTSIDSAIMRLELYNVFESPIYEGEQTISTIKNEQDILSCQFPLGIQPIDTIKTATYFELYVKAIATNLSVTRYDDAQKLSKPTEVAALQALKGQYGQEALVFPQFTENIWTCICGKENVASEDVCSICGREKEVLRDNDSALLLRGQFVARLMQATTIIEIQESFAGLKDTLPPEAYLEGERLLGSMETAARIYGAHVSDAQKEQLHKIVMGEI